MTTLTIIILLPSISLLYVVIKYLKQNKSNFNKKSKIPSLDKGKSAKFNTYVEGREVDTQRRNIRNKRTHDYKKKYRTSDDELGIEDVVLVSTLIQGSSSEDKIYTHEPTYYSPPSTSYSSGNSNSSDSSSSSSDD